MSREEELENRLTKAIQDLEGQFSDLANLRWVLTRALIHRAVHYATEKTGVEFCTLASYLGEMVGHAHKLAHGDNPKAPAHKDYVH